MGAWLTMGALIALVALAAAAATGWGMFAVARATHPPRYRSELTPTDFHLQYESLTLTAADGVRLGAWVVLPSGTPRGVVMVQHGYGTCRADPLPFISLACRGGYAAVSVDFRGHGESGGRCTFGREERLDVLAALGAIRAHPALQGLPVAYLGISLGAAVGILTAASEPAIRAVIADSSYARLGPMVSRYQRLGYHLPEAPFGWVTGVCLAVALRTPLASLDPVRAVGRLSPRPLLVIHGEGDASIPASHARDLYQAAGGPKELWVVPGAAHVASIYQADLEYPQRVLAFLAKHLA